MKGRRGIHGAIQRFLFVLTVLCLNISGLRAAETYPKREVRGVWVSPLVGDWCTSSQRGTTEAAAAVQKAAAVSCLDSYKAAGVNVVYLHVRIMGDRIYKKTTFTESNGTAHGVYESYSHYISGTRGSEAAYDPLEYWIQEAHARGIELYAWVNPYRFYSCNPTSDPGAASSYVPWLYQNCTLDKAAVSNGWIIHHFVPGKTSSDNGSAKYCYNPGLTAVKAKISNVCAVLTGNYDIDGIVFDDYFYPEGITETSSAEDWTTYQEASDKGSLGIADWRRKQVNDLISMCHETVHRIKPYVRFGVAPAGVANRGVVSTDNIEPLSKYCSASDWQYSKIYSDPIAWMRNKSVDFISPQLYWNSTHSTNPFGPLTQWWNQAAKALDCLFYPSISVADGWDVSEYVKEIKFTRTYSWDGNSGIVYYRGASIVNNNMGQSIKNQCTPHKSLHPICTHFSGSTPGTISGLKRSGTALTWNALSNTRYVVYAIPSTVNQIDAASEKGGYKAEYIVDITYTNSATLPSGKTSGYWYAVTPFDRYGREWPATTLNAPSLETLDVSLTSPANGVQAASDQTFSWSGTNGATFTLEISTSSAFSSIVLSQTTTAKSLTLNLDGLAHSTTHYWRVRANKDNANQKISETRSFTSPAAVDYPDLDKPQLKLPDDNATFYGDITFRFHSVTDATEYELQLSASSNFDNIAWSTKSFTKDGQYYECSMPFSAVADGIYCWRVIARAAKHDPGISSTRTLTKETLTGEQNYTIYREDHEYEFYRMNVPHGQKDLLIKNAWLRNKEHNPLNMDGSLCRDMVARPADGSAQLHDVVYVTSREGNYTGSEANYLARFDARDGRRMEDLKLFYDANMEAPYQAGVNDVMLDSNNDLYVATLSLPSSKYTTRYFNVCRVDPGTGVCTTVLSVQMPTTYRIDHCAIAKGSNYWTYYIFTVGNGDGKTYVTRYTLWGNPATKAQALKSTVTNVLSEYHGTAPSIHMVQGPGEVNQLKFVVNGQKTNPHYYVLNETDGTTISAQSKITGDAAPSDVNCIGFETFAMDGYHFAAMPYCGNSYSNYSPMWHIVQGDDFADGFSNVHSAQLFPYEGIGVKTEGDNNGGDLNFPLSFIKNGETRDASFISGENGRLFVYAPCTGLAAYDLNYDWGTGVEDISNDADDDEATAEYYNLQGLRVTPTAPGFYIRRSGKSVIKVLIR